MESVKKFEREKRYVVIKLSKCTKSQIERLDATFDNFASACIDCVVVEHDWPEYEPVWAMLERRMAGVADPNIHDRLAVAGLQGDWAIDTTAGRPILVYQGCSVIEAETAYWLLSLIRQHADPVPPAGGEPEALATDAAKAMQAAHNSCPLQLSGTDRMAWIADHFQRWYVRSEKPSITEALQKRIKELVDVHGSLRAVARHTGIDVGYLSRLDSGERDNPSVEVLSMLGVAVLDTGAHVTRLQAEVERQKLANQRLFGTLEKVAAVAAENKATVEALQSELTKARELLEHMLKDDDMPVHWFAQRIDDYLSNQSAPADKGQGGPLSELEVLREAVKELEAMRDARVGAKLAHGEPVAWIHPAYLEPGALGFEGSTVRLSSMQVPLYLQPAQQPAPVAVPYVRNPRSLLSDPHCPECGHPDCNGQCFGDDMMGDS